MKRLALILILVSAGFAQDDAGTRDKHYFVFVVSAEAYKNMPLGQRTTYLSGWLDSRLNAGIFGNAKTIKAQRDCWEGKTITQITAVVDKYVEGHPEGWDRPAANEADSALQSLCPSLR